MIYELFSQFSVKVCFWSYFYNYMQEEIPQTNSIHYMLLQRAQHYALKKTLQR